MEAGSKEDETGRMCGRYVPLCLSLCVGEVLSKQGEIFIQRDFVVGNVLN